MGAAPSQAWLPPPRTWLVFQMEPQVAFPEFCWAVLNPLGHTVTSSVLDFQPLYLKIP